MKAKIRQNTETLLVGNFPSLADLNNAYTALKDRYKEGEIAYIEDEQKYYKLDADGWKEFDVNIDSQGLSISLYELNKSAFSSAKPLTKEQLVVYAEEINNFVQEGQEYFMLLCKECSYYTILKDEKIGDGLGTVAFECLEACGEIVAVSNETDHYEIWVKNNKTANCYVLFNYDIGIVTF
jgi:hypothetical protein